MSASAIPQFAVMGHPNEGKSSVVATLTEDDRVPISPLPGETTECRDYELRAGDEVLLKFTDTPGFQNPKAVLEWFQSFEGDPSGMVAAFRGAHFAQPRFHHDCELLRPLEARTGILFVVDGSRPMRPEDDAEMEILRLTGLPRMAIINRKHEGLDFSQEWRAAFARSFNAVRVFDAHHSGFSERMALFEALKAIDQDWEAALGSVVDQFREEHKRRVRQVVLELEQLLEECLLHTERVPRKEEEALQKQEAVLFAVYQNRVRKLERLAHARIRSIFQHRKLDVGMDSGALVVDDLFSEQVWRVLGLSRKQLAWSSALTGAAIGAGADVATGGITFGIFLASGAVAGGLSAWWGAPSLGRKKIKLPGPLRDLRAGRQEVRVGPASSPQLAFVLLDRALIYTRQVMAWPHARRDPSAFESAIRESGGLVTDWSDPERKCVLHWYTVLLKGKVREDAEQGLRDLLTDKLTD